MGFFHAIPTSWANLKTVIQNRKLSVQYLELADQYYLMAIDGGFTVSCVLNRDGGADVLDFETNFKSAGNVWPNTVAISSQAAALPFAAKTIGTKKLYKRVTGATYSLTQGSNDLFYTLTFPWAKITGIELVGGEIGDKVNFFVLDTTAGTYSGTASAPLNQFAFNVNVAPQHYISTSEFDADLYENMQIKINYISASAKTVGVNYILNEVK